MKKIFLFFTIVSFSLFTYKMSYSQIPEWIWAHSQGGSGNELAWSITKSSDEFIYMTGYFMSPTITMGSTTLTNAGSTDIFIAKLDTSGNVLWAKSAGGSNQDAGYSVATDALGNLYLAGHFSSNTITFDTTTLTNNNTNNSADIYIVKFDGDGNVMWVKSFGGQGWDYCNSIAVDGFGNAYIIGGFSSLSLTFDTFLLTNLNTYYDIYIAKFDTNGNVLWAKSAGNNYSDYGYSITTDTSDNIYVAGYFVSPTITFDTITLTNVENNGTTLDLFLVKYDTSGNAVWAKSAGGIGINNSDGYMPSVKTDAMGNTYVTGHFRSLTISFDTITLTNTTNNSFEVFLVKYDKYGNVLWAKSASGTNDDVGLSAAIDSYGNVIISGWFKSSTITFNSYTLTNANTNASTDIYLTKYDPMGNIIWAKSVGGDKNEGTCSVFADSTGHVYIAGYFQSSPLSFGSNLLTNTDNSGSTSDLYLAKLGNDITTGINDVSNSFDFSIFPNPTTDIIKISSSKEATIEILNINGQIIKTINHDSGEFSVDIRDLSSGVYIIKAKTDKKIVTKKFIKQ
jgi:hypothetical protein